MKRAVIIITDGRYVTGLTLRNGDDSWNDELENLWLETGPQLLADLDSVLGLASIGVLELRGAHREDAEEQIKRVRAAIGDTE